GETIKPLSTIGVVSERRAKAVNDEGKRRARRPTVQPLHDDSPQQSPHMLGSSRTPTRREGRGPPCTAPSRRGCGSYASTVLVCREDAPDHLPVGVRDGVELALDPRQLGRRDPTQQVLPRAVVLLDGAQLRDEPVGRDPGL